MKNPAHRLALYTATILFSALPFAVDFADADDKVKKKHVATAKTSTEISLEKREKTNLAKINGE